MIIEGVDPRDTQWEIDQPVYRVYFWHQPPAPPDIPQEHMGYHCDEHRLAGAEDIHEVLRWATEAARPEQTFTLYVEVNASDRGPGLIHLAGIDPTIPL